MMSNDAGATCLLPLLPAASACRWVRATTLTVVPRAARGGKAATRESGEGNHGVSAGLGLSCVYVLCVCVLCVRSLGLASKANSKTVRQNYARAVHHNPYLRHLTNSFNTGRACGRRRRRR